MTSIGGGNSDGEFSQHYFFHKYLNLEKELQKEKSKVTRAKSIKRVRENQT
jgi:hypothetical protein